MTMGRKVSSTSSKEAAPAKRLLLKVSGAGNDLVNGYYNSFNSFNGKPRFIKIVSEGDDSQPTVIVWSQRDGKKAWNLATGHRESDHAE